MECAEYDAEGEAPSCFTERLVHKARVRHKCGECGRNIDRGEGYMRESGVWDGKPETHKTCLDCLSIRRAFFSSYIYGEVISTFRELIEQSEGRINETAMLKLTVGGFAHAERIIHEVWDNIKVNNSRPWIFTFGQGHEHNGQRVHNHFVRIWAEDRFEARQKMCAKYGQVWAFQYDTEDNAGVRRFNLKLLEEIQ